MLRSVSRALGWLFGRLVASAGLVFLRRRAERFDVRLQGAMHLQAMAGRPYLLVSNHVGPVGSVLRWPIRVRGFGWMQRSLDSFIFYRMVFELTGARLSIAAKCDRGRWSARRPLRALQKQIGQPFGKGLFAAVGFLPVEHKSGCYHRDFLRAASEAARRGRPILMFPQGGNCQGFDLSQFAQPGAAHLALRLGLPIVPAYIDGCESWSLDATVTVCFGPAFLPREMSKAQLSQRIGEEVAALKSAFEAKPGDCQQPASGKEFLQQTV